MILFKEMKKYESGDKEWLINYNENKLWAKTTLRDHLASSPATVALYFNDSIQLSLIKWLPCTWEKESVLFLICLLSSSENKKINIFFVLS